MFTLRRDLIVRVARDYLEAAVIGEVPKRTLIHWQQRGRHAAELISVIALAITANLKVTDIEESLLVQPAIAEALAEAAE